MQLQKYLILTLFIISFSFSNLTFATQQTQDTIQTFDKEAFKVSLKELGPKEFSRLFMQQYQKDSLKAAIGVKYIKEEMLLSDDLGVQFWGYFTLAYWNNQNLNQNECLTNLDKGLLIGKSLDNDTLILNSFQYKGKYCFDFGRYEEAIDNYLDALKMANKLNANLRKLIISHDMSLIKMQTNDFEGAVEIMEGILEEIQDDESHPILLNIYISLTKGYIGIENYNKAKLFCENGLILSEKQNNEDAKFYFYSFLAEIAIKDGDYKKAHESIEKSLQISRDKNILSYEVPILFIDKGAAYFGEEKYQMAIETLLKAETLMLKNKLNFIKLEEAYALLGKSYKQIGDLENSLKYFEKANEVYKENDKRQGNINVDIIKKYDLKSLKEELSLAEKKTEKTRVILYVSVFLALFICAGLVYFYKKREKENQQKFAKILQSLEEEKEQVVTKKTIPNKENNLQHKEIELETPKEVEIIDETKAKLLKKLENFEAKELFLSKNCSLNDVAKKLKTNTSYLSKLVNSHKGKSFSAYITDLRVNYAIRRLKEDKKFRSYTIDSIAQEIGFNRSESFSRAFKNKTGLYPSYYIKNLDNKGVG